MVVMFVILKQSDSQTIINLFVFCWRKVSTERELLGHFKMLLLIVYNKLYNHLQFIQF